MPSFGIVGHGFVGRATARCFMEHGEVRIYDVVPELRTHSVEETLACDFVFICLPTPDDCDTSIIEEFFSNHVHPFDAAYYSETTFILKSTVPVGTTKSLAQRYAGYIGGIVHSPEFLTARCAVVDAQCPARMIVGDTSSDYQKTNKAAIEVLRLYRARFPGANVILMRSDESEFVKLACNSFFALKVWFFNALREQCGPSSLDWEQVRAGILSDGRIAHAHTQVPGQDGGVGFGGACLPKDLTALAKLTGSPVLRMVLKDNARMRGE